MAYKWYTYNSKSVTSSNKIVGQLIMPSNVFRFKFSDTTFNPSSITASSIGSICAQYFSWTNVYPGIWDCTVTLKSGYENSYWGLFHNAFANLFEQYGITVELINAPDTSRITRMSSMFNNCGALVNVVSFNTANVTNLSDMFADCYRLKTIPRFDTRSAVNMSGMLAWCYELEKVPLLNTSSAKYLDGMLRACKKITGVPLFDTSNAVNVSSMFAETGITVAPVINTSKATNMEQMFEKCKSLSSVPLYDTSSVTNMSAMFFGCESLTSVPLFDTSKVTDFSNMFGGYDSTLGVEKYVGSGITSIPDFNVSSATNAREMFAACTEVQSGITSMYNKLSSLVPALSTNGHYRTFYQCGSNTTTGAAELAQIPSDWK